MSGSIGGRAAKVTRRINPPRVFTKTPAAQIGDGGGACFSQIFSESFNKANGALGPDLTWWDGASQPSVNIAVVVSNAATIDTGDIGAVALCQTDMTLDDKRVDCVLGAWTLPGSSFVISLGICARWDLGPNPAGGSIIGNEFLVVQTDSAGVTTWTLHNFYEDGGAPGGMASVTGTTPAPGDTVSLYARGVHLSGSLNGVSQVVADVSPGNNPTSAPLVALNPQRAGNLSGAVSVASMSVETYCPPP